MIKRKLVAKDSLAILPVVALLATATAAFADDLAAGQAMAAPPAATPVDSATAGGGDVNAGPLLDARRMLLQRLGQAKKEGIGTGAYMTEFQSIEQAVSAGQAEELIKPRVERLARGLKDQIDRGKMLKLQRPVPTMPPPSALPPPADTAAAPVAPPAGGGLAGALGGKDPSGILEKVKEKFGGGNLPPGAADFLNSDKGRKLLERLNK